MLLFATKVLNLKHNELDFPTELYTLASLSKYFMVLAVYKFLCMWLAFEHLVLILKSFMIMARIAPTWRTRLSTFLFARLELRVGTVRYVVYT